MIDNKTPFYAYRYLVTPISDQTTIHQQANGTKESLITDIINEVSKDAKTEWSIGQKRYLFYGYQQQDNINIIKFAKESHELHYGEGDYDIEISTLKSAKYVHLIIDTKNQVILLERNSSVFQKIDSSINVLRDFLRNSMKTYDYVVNIYPLSTKKQFWNFVESADEIYELSLEMNAPNMALFGDADTRKILEEIKKSTNSETFDISFKNKEGKLKILKSVLGGYIDYVREVGGKYLLKYKQDGVMQSKKSSEDVTRVRLNIKQSGEYSTQEIDEIKDKLNSVHKLDTREE